MQFEEQVPDELGAEQWDEETTLVLGAPAIGKSYLFRAIEDLIRVTTLTGALESDTDEYVVVDEFYRAYQAADSDTRAAFATWVATTDGICISARPRAFDWLLTHERTDLTAEILAAFDAAYHLRYDPETDQERAVEQCLQIGGSGADGLDREAVSEHIDAVLTHREYEFESPALRDAFGTSTYSATLVPGLVAYLSEVGATDGIFVSESVITTAKEVGRDVLSNEALNGFVNSIRDNNLFSRQTLASVRETVGDLPDVLSNAEAPFDDVPETVAPAALGGVLPFLGPAAVGGGALALWLKLRGDGGLEQGEVFDVLAGEELSPTARVELERELGLPPRTLDNFQRLTRGETIERLLQYREQTETELAALADDIADTGRRVEDTREDVAAVESRVEETLAELDAVRDDVGEQVGGVESRLDEHERILGELQETVEAIDHSEDAFAAVRETLTTLEANAVDAEASAPFVSEAIQNATGSLADLESTLLLDEKRLLQTGEIDSEIPYYGNEDSDIVEMAAADDEDVVVLRGSHGTGKSTAALRACRTLAARGHSVRLPYFENSSAEFVERSLAAAEGDTVVFAFYKRGTSDDNVLRTERQLRLLLDWLDRGLCSTVIIECRDELHSSFTQLDRLIEDHSLTDRFQERREIRFDPFDPGDDQIERTVRWTLAELDYEGDRDAIVASALDLAEGNPEVAKIAARFATAEDHQLDEMATMDELIWEDIKDIFSEESVVDRGVPVGHVVFEYLSAIREARTKELERMLHGTVTRSQLKRSAHDLSGYLGGEVGEAVLGDPTPDEEMPDWMDTGELDDTSSEDSFEIEIEDGDTWEVAPDVYAEVAFRRVGLAHNREGESPRFGDYLEDLAALDSGERYLGLAENLALAYTKADEWGAEGLQTLVVRSSYRLLARADTQGVDPKLFTRCFDELVFDGVPLDPGLIESASERLVSGTQVVEAEYSVDAPVLMQNYLSRLWVNHLEFGSHAAFDGIRHCGEQLAQSYETATGYDASQFLENVYSMAIKMLADSYADPTSQRMSDWLDDIERRATATAQADSHPDDAGTFMSWTYGWSVKKIVTSRTLSNRAQNDWRRALVSHVIGGFELHWMSTFHAKFSSSVGRSRVSAAEQTERCLVDAIALLAGTEFDTVESRDERVRRVAHFVATGLAQLEEDSFERLAEALDELEDREPALHADLVETVPERLESLDDDGVGILWRRAIADGTASFKPTTLQEWKQLADVAPGQVADNVATVAEGLSEERGTDRNAAAIALSYTAKEYPDRVAEVVPTLVETLRDDHWYNAALSIPERLQRVALGYSTVRYNVALTLWRIASERPDELLDVLPAVVEGFEDGNRDFRDECLDVLAAVDEAHPEEARAAVREFLSAQFDELSGGDAEQEGAVRRIVARLGGGETEDDDDSDPDDHNQVARAAALAATEFPAVVGEFLDDLVALFDSEDGQTRRHATMAVKRVATSQPGLVVGAVDPLSDALEDEQGDVREFAAQSLSSIAGEDSDALEPAVPALVTSLDDSHAVVPEQAASALRTVADDTPGTVLPHTPTLVAAAVAGVGDDGDLRELLHLLADHDSGRVSEALEQEGFDGTDVHDAIEALHSGESGSTAVS